MSGSPVQHTEIERAFQVRSVPTTLGPGTPIEQHYIAIDVDVTVRVRRAGAAHWLTVKGGRGRERTEVEMPIDAAQFDVLAALSGGRSIEKQRHHIELDDGLVAEFDRFGGTLAGLDLVEVEFANREEADSFRAPDWFGAELTDVAGWSNAELATIGRPPH